MVEYLEERRMEKIEEEDEDDDDDDELEGELVVSGISSHHPQSCDLQITFLAF